MLHIRIAETFWNFFYLKNEKIKKTLKMHFVFKKQKSTTSFFFTSMRPTTYD